MLKNLAWIFQIFLVYWLLSLACFLMLRIVIGYTTFEDHVQFLVFKQAYIHDPIWKTAFYIHVFSAVLALFAGFTQFSKQFLTQHRKWHRIIGKMYVWNILAINFPAGMILALNANGELPGKIAFVALDTLWAYFTLKALISARHKDFYTHRNYMIRSYALTFSAITLRAWHMVLSHYLPIDPMRLYVMEAWLGFVPNLIAAEWIIQRRELSRKFHTHRIGDKNN